MRLSKLGKLIKEEIQKLQEQDWPNPDTDCNVEPFNPNNPYQVEKMCDLCEGESIDTTGLELNEYGFWIEWNGCFCCKDFNDDGTPIDEDEDNDGDGDENGGKDDSQFG